MNELTNFNFDDLKKLVYREFSQQQQLERVERRNQLIKFDIEAPKYLLEPEIKNLFSFVENYNELMLLKTLWFTGARISEALMLTPSNFSFGIQTCLMTLPTQKKKKLVKRETYTENGVKKTKNIYEKKMYFRNIQLFKSNETQREYLEELNRYIITNKVGKNDLIFKYSRFQVNRFITKAQKLAEKNGITFPFDITPHTFRHSCAMNLYYNRIDEKVIQGFLGHSRIENTQKYTRIFHLENDLSHVNF